MNANEAKAETVVMEDSAEAASVQTVTGWVSRRGHFFGADASAERTARYDGCTHRKCDGCGAVIARGWLKCPECREKGVSAKWQKLERRPWDGVTPLSLYDTDTYFFDESDIEIYCEEHEVKAEDLRLVFCDPVKPGHVNANELFCDQLADDHDVDDAGVLAAVEALNKAIDAAQPFSWLPGNVAAIMPEVKCQEK